MNGTDVNIQIVIYGLLLLLAVGLSFVGLFYWQRWLNKKMGKWGSTVHQMISRKDNKED